MIMLGNQKIAESNPVGIGDVEINNNFFQTFSGVSVPDIGATIALPMTGTDANFSATITEDGWCGVWLQQNGVPATPAKYQVNINTRGFYVGSVNSHGWWGITIPVLKGDLVNVVTTGMTLTTGSPRAINQLNSRATTTPDINRPDLLQVGVEHSFGSNLFGKRYTGTLPAITALTSHSIILDASLEMNIRIMEYGGWWQANAGAFAPVPYTHVTSSVPVSASVWWGTGGLRFTSYYNLDRLANMPYEIFVKYKKV